jgi:hypothetical protein
MAQKRDEETGISAEKYGELQPAGGGIRDALTAAANAGNRASAHLFDHLSSERDCTCGWKATLEKPADPRDIRSAWDLHIAQVMEAGNRASEGDDPVRWRVGDRVCFAHLPDNPLRVTATVGVPTGTGRPDQMVEVEGFVGQFAAHLFIAAPIDLPPIELQPREPVPEIARVLVSEKGPTSLGELARLVNDVAPAPDTGALYRAVQTAARDLPEGFLLRLCVEKGAGWVALEYPGAPFHYSPDGGGMTLSEQILDAVEKAKTTPVVNR